MPPAPRIAAPLSAPGGCRGGCRWAGLALLVLGAGVPDGARAGAWTLAEGDGQIITTSGRQMAPVSALFDGVPERDSNSLQIFVEYGLSDTLTLGLTGRAELVSTTAQLDLEIGGHARYRVWQGAVGDVVSVQVAGNLPLERRTGRLLAGGTEGHVAEAQAGVLYGRGWQTGWGDSFVSTELAFRWRGGRQADELRLEATAGHRPIRQIMGLVSVYAAAPLGDGDASLKLAPSIAYTFWPWLGPNDKKPDGPLYPSTVQLGITYDLVNPGDGIELGVSVWKSF